MLRILSDCICGEKMGFTGQRESCRMKVDCLMQLERKMDAEKNQGGEHSATHLRFLRFHWIKS